ncbi:septation protein A [Thalassotalea crassostreae]|uniref:septation protein A n=1 Tax=Thalassotalea crassostreae TaxID=1763536 RepID=UPI0008396F84|nr:septation protein A [Thalassotalea crassostreae]
MAAFFEFIPLIIFFVFYKMFDVFVATGALIVASFIQIAILKFQKKTVSKQQWIVLGMVSVFGGMTIFFHNDAFIKWKVTVIYGFFAAGLLFSRYVLKKNLLEKMLGEQLKAPSAAWDKVNIMWVLFFIACAVSNVYVAFSFSQDVWVNYKVFGLTIAMFVFAIISMIPLFKYMPKDDEPQVVEDKTENKE